MLQMVQERLSVHTHDQVSAFVHKVCAAYLAAPIMQPGVTHHWDALADSSRKFYKMAMSDIKIEMAPTEMYSDAEEMKRRVKAEKLMYVSEEYVGHPYWDDNTYQCFRAVHDYIVHCEGHSDFTDRGELRACNLHTRLVPHAARPAVFTEITGKTSVVFVTGDFGPQKVAVLDQFDFANIGVIHGDQAFGKKL